MDRPWNSLQKNPVQTAKMQRGKAQRGQVQESKIQTDKIKKEKPQRMIVTDETSVYGIDMALSLIHIYRPPRWIRQYLKTVYNGV